MNSHSVDWADVDIARIPAASLSVLAAQRCRPGITVEKDGNDVWVNFPPGDLEVLYRLRPVAGVEFLARRGKQWFRFGQRLPTVAPFSFQTPVALKMAILPGSFEPERPSEAAIQPVPIRIVRGGTIQPASAMRTEISAMARWANVATSAELASVRAARCGDRVVLLGRRLPILAGAQRLWGERLLVPLGFRPDPELSDDVLRAACGATSQELLILDDQGAEIVDEGVFEVITRAGIRLAAR